MMTKMFPTFAISDSSEISLHSDVPELSQLLLTGTRDEMWSKRQSTADCGSICFNALDTIDDAVTP